jgi:hypothetical protein
MTEIEVVAHGDRWAVRVSGDTRSEHLTRQEAEMEARRLGDADPDVREDDPTGLADVQSGSAAGGGPDGGPSGVRPSELPRETQAGL